MKGIDLMRTMRFAAAMAVGALLMSGCTEKPRVLRLYTWFEYTSPEVVSAFERKHDCTVEIRTFDTNEEMITKLRDEGCGAYDLIVPSAYLVRQMANEGMIAPIDHTKCPSVKRNFLQEYAKMVPDDSELKYSVPYGISCSRLMYATNRIPAGVAVDSWAVLGNPALKGHVFLLNDMREILGLALMYRGYSANSEDAGEIAAAADQVLAWAPNVAQWDSDDSLFSKGGDAIWLWHTYGDTANQMISEEGPVALSGMAISSPKEGSVFSCEVMAVSFGCRNADLAYAFIEFLYADAGIGRAHMSYNGCLLPCAPALEDLSPRMRELVVPSAEVLARGQVLNGFDGKPEVQALYERAWERIVRER